jgi:ABC-type oligopeptide transport system substrate-binding subunit
MDTYRYSDYISLSPETYTTKLSFNTSYEKLESRQTEGVNKTILANKAFRNAFSLAINRQDFAASCTASSSAGFGLLNYYYMSDPDTGEIYRETAQGQQVLKDLYKIDDVSRVTGFDKATASTLFEQAYQEELAAGHIKATDKIELEFLTYLLDESYVKIVNAIQKYVNEATAGTSLEGKIVIKQTADDDYYTKMQAGQCEMILSTWGGNPMNPFAITSCYCDPSRYFEYGYDTKQSLTIEIDTPAGKQAITQSLEDWDKSLNQGAYATASKETKLTILGAIEYKILSDYATLPLYYRCAASLDSQRVVNGAEKYIPLIGYGGVRFITYTYDDAAWAAYCADQKYKLTY